MRTQSAEKDNSAAENTELCDFIAAQVLFIEYIVNDIDAALDEPQTELRDKIAAVRELSNLHNNTIKDAMGWPSVSDLLAAAHR